MQPLEAFRCGQARTPLRLTAKAVASCLRIRSTLFAVAMDARLNRPCWISALMTWPHWVSTDPCAPRGRRRSNTATSARKQRQLYHFGPGVYWLIGSPFRSVLAFMPDRRSIGSAIMSGD